MLHSITVSNGLIITNLYIMYGFEFDAPIIMTFSYHDRSPSSA